MPQKALEKEDGSKHANMEGDVSRQTYVIPTYTVSDAAIGEPNGCIKVPKMCKAFEGGIVRLS
jgi:hypothetical protein